MPQVHMGLTFVQLLNMQSPGVNVILEHQTSLDVYLGSGCYKPLLSSLKLCSPIKNLTTQQIENLISNIGIILRDERVRELGEDQQDLITQIFKVLRNLCTRGNKIQTKICLMPDFYSIVSQLLNSNHALPEAKLLIFQCLANICVQNNQTQSITWNQVNTILIENLSIQSKCHNIAAMILYNIFIDAQNSYIFGHDSIIFIKLINIIFDRNQKAEDNIEFINLFMEYFLIRYEGIVPIYTRLEIETRINTIKYCIELVKVDDHNRCLNKNFIVFLLNDFKTKSDSILNVNATRSSNLVPREIILTLELITHLSASNLYKWILHNDKSLFLNIGCLLLSIHDLGKVTNSIFTPAPKLKDFITSKDSTNPLENDISYEFKTMLVRCIANLSYKNKANQNLARDIKILLTVLECTNMDAKNPLIKEWSILAIRNLCENNQENQNLIKSLTKLGDSLSSIIVDGRTENGSIRINLNNN